MKEVYKAKIIKKTADGKVPLEVALMQQVQEERDKDSNVNFIAF